jgi:transketolase
MLHNGNQSLWLDNITRGMEMRGASAPLKELQRKFGFEPDRVVAAAKELLGRA